MRAIAAFLSHETIGEFRWEARSGFLDTSGGYGSHVSNEYFERFPAAAERLRTEEADDFSSVPAYRFWFLIERTSASRQPRLAIEATHGIAWDETGVRYDLMEIYRRDRRIWPVVFEVACHLLP